MAETALVASEKLLMIRIVDGSPTFIFTGNWTGKDITFVSHLLTKNYRMYKREQKRSNLKEE